MGETHVFKTTFSRYLSVAFAAVAVFASIFIVVGDPRELTRSVPFLLGAAIIVWILFGYPHVEISDGGITVVNVLRRVHVPWPCFTGASTEWNLRIHTDGATYASWALPISSGTARRIPRRHRSAPDGAPESLGNSAEAAALVIGERLKQLTEAGHLSPSPMGEVEVRTEINRITLTGAAITVALVAVGLL